MRIAARHLSFLKIETICISHIHGDHIFGLYGLLSTMGLYGRRTPLRIFGPNPVGAMLKFFLSYYGEGIGFGIDFTPVSCREPQVICDGGFFEISAFPLNHGIETYGYMLREKLPPLNVRKECIERYGLTLAEIAAVKRGEDLVREPGPDIEPGIATGFRKFSGTSEPLMVPNQELTYRPFSPRSYAYCSDTAPFPQLSGWLEGADLLYHEATYMQEMQADAAARHHSTARDAALCARDAGVGRLLLGHYSSRYTSLGDLLSEAREIFPETYLTNDGDVFDIEYIRETK